LPATWRSSNGAEVILGLRDSVGDPAATQIVQGESFTVEVVLSVTEAEQVIGLGFWLSELGNAWSMGNGLFLSGRFIPATSPFDDVITSDGALTSGPGNRLDPLSDRDIGALTDGTPYDPFTDPEVVMELTIGTIDPSVLGSFTIRFSNSPQGIGLEWVDAQFDPHPFDSVGDGYVVQVIPEPAPGALLALGLAGLAARRRTRS
jgi:hypothetical protein